MTTIILRGADASASAEYELPFDRIEYLNFYTSARTLECNLGQADSVPVVTGVPTVTDGYAEFVGVSKYVSTGVMLGE